MIELFTVIANKVGVSTSLLLAICTAESNLHNMNNFKDGNGKGSHGICMVNVNTARTLVPHADMLALQQIKFNIKIAAMYLKQKQDKYAYEDLYIAAYNAGIPIFNKRGKLINHKYVEKVLKIRENIYGELE